MIYVYNQVKPSNIFFYIDLVKIILKKTDMSFKLHIEDIFKAVDADLILGVNFINDMLV